ncbi:MAG: cytidine deaminase [Acidobacteriaceae bacterium]|nr:cytidine deaminase [Acidobacteriaceae bacterium]
MAANDQLSSALARFSEKSRQRILQVVSAPDFSGQLPAAQVKAVCEAEQLTADEVMLALLPLARTYSRPPISNYQVGTVVRGAEGDCYLGANLEIPGQPLGFSVHGEQSALSNAYMHGERGVLAIAVTAAPCGHCRQFMNELAPEIQILVQGKPAASLSTLLPGAFGPKDLGVTDLPFPVRDINLQLDNAGLDELSRAALEAARKSYAPYTKAYSGLAIRVQSGRIFKGAYIENAAYNPSLPPLQAALSALVLAGGDFSEIAAVVLVEKTGAPISQKSVAEAALGAIAPKVKMQTGTARS